MNRKIYISFIIFIVLFFMSCSETTETNITHIENERKITKTAFHLTLIDEERNPIPNKIVILSKLEAIDKDNNLIILGEVKAKTDTKGLVVFNLEDLHFYFPGNKYVALVDNNTSICIDAPSRNHKVSTQIIYKLKLATKYNCK